jgi:hypothetical protein
MYLQPRPEITGDAILGIMAAQDSVDLPGLVTDRIVPYPPHRIVPYPPHYWLISSRVRGKAATAIENEPMTKKPSLPYSNFGTARNYFRAKTLYSC